MESDEKSENGIRYKILVSDYEIRNKNYKNTFNTNYFSMGHL